MGGAFILPVSKKDLKDSKDNRDSNDTKGLGALYSLFGRGLAEKPQPFLQNHQTE